MVWISGVCGWIVADINSACTKETAMPTRNYGPTYHGSRDRRMTLICTGRAVVTGASSGIGIKTARALASTGAEVTLAVRNLAAGGKVADDIAEQLPAGAGGVRSHTLDLADPASVAGFVRA